LVRKALFPKVKCDVKYVIWSEAGNAGIVLRIWGKLELTVVCCHLAFRQRGVKQVIAILEMVKNYNRALVMGGFGVGVDSITLRKFFEVGFRSLTPPEFDERATYFPGTKLLSCTRNDYILGRGVIRSSRTSHVSSGVQILENSKGMYCEENIRLCGSDHLPIFAEILFRESEARREENVCLTSRRSHIDKIGIVSNTLPGHKCRLEIGETANALEKQKKLYFLCSGRVSLPSSISNLKLVTYYTV
jgi:hypothetical protein